MTAKLSEEQRRALQDHRGRPVEIEDDLTRKRYLLVAKDDFGQMVGEELRWQLQVGLDQADRGELEEWDLEEFLDRMHRQHPAKRS